MKQLSRLDQILERRGLLKAAEFAGWRADGYGWRYPVKDFSGRVLAWRWKNADSNAEGKKYRWPGGRGEAVYYHPAPRHFLQAVENAGGLVYIANGEPSALAYLAAGYANVFSWFGETSVPATLAADLAAWGVTTVCYPADNDSSGTKSAKTVRDKLIDSGIHLQALAWGDVGEKYDANDLWIETGENKALFASRLADLQALELPANEAKQREDYREPGYTFSGETDSAQVAEALAYIPGEGLPYDDWYRIVAGVSFAFSENEAISLLETWTGHASKPGEIRASVKSFQRGNTGRPVTLGTVFHCAQQYGYQFPTIAGTANYSKSKHGPTEAELTPENVIADPFADLPDVTPPDLTYRPPATLQQRDDSARWPGWDEGLLEVEEQAIAMLGKKNEDVLLYVYVAGGLWQGATARELAEKSVELGAPISYGRVLSAWMADGGEMFQFLETEKEDIYPVYKTQKKSRGRAAERRQLIDRQALHNLFKRRAAYKLADTAATTTDGAVLPMYIKAELLENLGIDGDLEQIAGRLADITDRLKVQKPDFKTDIDRWYARFKRLWGDIIDALSSSDFSETVIDDDLRNHAHATGSMILQAQRERDYVTRNPDQPRSRWATMTYTGVSNGSVNKLRDLAKLRHIGGQPPVQRAEIRTIDPVDAMKQAQEVQKQAGGRITHVAGADGRFYPYNRNNVQNCLSHSLQAGDDVLYFELSVAGPLERYEPEPQPERQSELIERPTIERIEADQDTEERRRTRRQRYEGPGHDPHIAVEQIYILMRETGWIQDESLSAWRDPAGRYWPDHAPTLVNRLTGAPVKNARGPLTEAELHTRELNAALEADESAEVPIERPYFHIIFGRKTS